MVKTRLERVLDDALERLGDGDATSCAAHQPCGHRRNAALQLHAAREADDLVDVRRALAAAYAVERMHPVGSAVAPGPGARARDQVTMVGTDTWGPGAEKTPEGSLWTLTYVSQAPHPPTSDELDRILEVSQRNNARLDVTGVLQCDGTTYAQTLEGDVDAVASLFGRISTDRRHSSVTILRSSAIPMRRYAEWRMALDRL